MPIDRAIECLALPVIAITADQLQREPDIHKTAIFQEDTHLVGAWKQNADNNVGVFNHGDLTQCTGIDQAHASASNSSRKRSRSNSR